MESGRAEGEGKRIGVGGRRRRSELVGVEKEVEVGGSGNECTNSHKHIVKHMSKASRTLGSEKKRNGMRKTCGGWKERSKGEGKRGPSVVIVTAWLI